MMKLRLMTVGRHIEICKQRNADSETVSSLVRIYTRAEIKFKDVKSVRKCVSRQQSLCSENTDQSNAKEDLTRE